MARAELATVEAQSDVGLYRIHFTPHLTAGKLPIVIKVDGSHIRGSPLHVSVGDPRTYADDDDDDQEELNVFARVAKRQREAEEAKLAAEQAVEEERQREADAAITI